jgi:nickel-dependent lactate racemase
LYSELVTPKNEITLTQKTVFLENLIDNYDDQLKRVLIIPPDFTRFHSNAGELTEIMYNYLRDRCTVTILPALGTHAPLTEEETRIMFGKIPKSVFLKHDWRNDVVEMGIIPSDFIEEVSEQKLNYSIKVEINKHLLSEFDVIISIGQVVPHEVVGMANGNKNILVGVGGSDMINKSHFLGACYGMERIMGRIDTPVRAILDYANEIFLEGLPLIYIHTVIEPSSDGKNTVNGLFGGEMDAPFRNAAKLSQEINVTKLDNALEKVIVYLDPDEYKSTWVGNKAIYRTRMALQDNGELIILAPGIRSFGEDMVIDGLIRKFGYRRSHEILNAVEKNLELRENLSAAAHLIHGSSEDRFNVTYCTNKLPQSEIEGVNLGYKNLSEEKLLYDPKILKDGYNFLPSGEEIYFIQNPALGLWTAKNKFL